MSDHPTDTDGEPLIIAPDGMEVRLHPSLAGGSMAHFRMPAGKTGRAVRHWTVEELWYVLEGQGEMWFGDPDGTERILALQPGVSFAIPVGTRFQLRNAGNRPLDAIAVTMPPWPGEDEAEFVTGKWNATI